MKKQSTTRSTFFNPRALIGFALCLSGVLLASVALGKVFAQAPSAPTHVRVSAVQLPEASLFANAKLNYKIIDAPNHSYGYDIFADGRLIIHQTSVPALLGNEGFKTKDGATKVALRVIEKLRKGEMLPTISVDEMKQLRVIQ